MNDKVPLWKSCGHCGPDVRDFRDGEATATTGKHRSDCPSLLPKKELKSNPWRPGDARKGFIQ